MGRRTSRRISTAPAVPSSWNMAEKLRLLNAHRLYLGSDDCQVFEQVAESMRNWSIFVKDPTKGLQEVGYQFDDSGYPLAVSCRIHAMISEQALAKIYPLEYVSAVVLDDSKENIDTYDNQDSLDSANSLSQAEVDELYATVSPFDDMYFTIDNDDPIYHNNQIFSVPFI